MALARRLRMAALVAALAAVPGGVAADIGSSAIGTPEPGSAFGWHQQGRTAAEAVAEAYGLELVVAEGMGYGDIRPTLRELAAEGVDLMIAHAGGYNTTAPEIARETGVPVAIVDDPDGLVPGLVADYTLSGHEGAYLAGVLAARTTRTGTLGIVVSGEPPAWNAQSAAFAEGARSVAADIGLVYAVIGPAAYSDAAGGRRVTDAVIAAGADIVFGQGNGSTFGMIQAVETGTAADGGAVWFIDVIGDKSQLDTGHLLSSVLWNMAPTYSAMIDDLNAGRFGTTAYTIGLADGSVELLRTPHIPDAVWQDVMAVHRQIVDGAIAIAPVYDAVAVRALMSSVDAP